LAGDIQEINASLAIQLVFHWLNARGGELKKPRVSTA
jgi:hypothetical protein